MSLEIIGALAGLIGGFLGAVALIFQIWQFIISSYRLRIELSESFILDNGKLMIGLQIRNVGRLPIMIEETYFVLEDDTRAAISAFFPGTVFGPTFPLTIEMHSSRTWQIERSQLAIAMAEKKCGNQFFAIAQTSTGKNKKSKPRRLNLIQS